MKKFTTMTLKVDCKQNYKERYKVKKVPNSYPKPQALSLEVIAVNIFFSLCI